MRIILSLWVFFLFAAHVDAHAGPARVEGRAHCFAFEGKDHCSFTIWLNGEINSGAVNEIKDVLDRRRAWIGDKQVEHLFYIDSPGGDLAAAMAIGRMIRKERLTLLVSKGHECVSACVMVLAGAVHRGTYGKIGIHRPFFDPPLGSEPLTPDKVRSNYQTMLQELRGYLREMNVSERLADDMLAIDPADVRYLSINQLYDYGLRSIDPIEQETVDLQEARALGLDRREYMRRTTLRKAKCWDAALKTLEAVEACNERIMKFGR
jgi:hypothetical protein